MTKIIDLHKSEEGERTEKYCTHCDIEFDTPGNWCTTCSEHVRGCFVCRKPFYLVRWKEYTGFCDKCAGMET